MPLGEFEYPPARLRKEVELQSIEKNSKKTYWLFESLVRGWDLNEGIEPTS
jgi:hypothetical protein